jgi:predicted dehydrogenase
MPVRPIAGARGVRYAVVGLGWIAQESVLPAFRNAAANSRLAAIVSGNAAKRDVIAAKHDVSVASSYDEYDALLASGDIDAVYIALPNHLHAEYAIRAAQHGVHVLCEKPMALTGDECNAMIDAARTHDVRLMIAYRLHFDEANLRAADIVRSGSLGEPRLFSSLNMQNVAPGDSRLRRHSGGGTLLDIGIYCINAARCVFGAEPTAGFATGASRGDPRFSEVHEMTSVVLRFPGERLATFSCSFGSAPASNFRVVGTEGDLFVDRAYTFKGERHHTLTRAGSSERTRFDDSDQFAPLLLHFSDCVRHGTQPVPDGTEGLIDTRIIEGLHASLESGTWVRFELPDRKRRPDLSMAMHCPPVHDPDLIEATDPTS